jgi:BlaR1 peptidase M56/Gram-negative bacterial TonB protein C-terminal
MFTYFLQVNLCWLLFYGLYYALLSRETFFTLNRTYLIISLLTGLILPLTADWLRTETPLAMPVLDSIVLPTFVVGMKNKVQELKVMEWGNIWSWRTIISIIYLTGIGIMSLRFLGSLFHIFSIFKTANSFKKDGVTVAYTEGVSQPFSFFHFIFINEKTLQDIDFQNIMQHEKAHVKQRHSFDVVFLELLNIAFWFSPLIYVYKNSLRTVPEYLADAMVLRSVSKRQYGTLLIQQAQSGKALALTNPFFSQLKKRIMMITRNPSKRRALVKYVLALPIFLLLVSFLATPDNAAMSVTETMSNRMILKVSDIKELNFKDVLDSKTYGKALEDFGTLHLTIGNKKSNFLEHSLTITLAGLENGTISADLVQQQTQFRLIQSNQKTCDVQSFEAYKATDTGEVTDIFNNTGSQFKPSILNLLKSVEDGDKLVFQNIKTRCPNDVTAQNYPSMVFEIKGDNNVESHKIALKKSPFYKDTKDYSYDAGHNTGAQGIIRGSLREDSPLNKYMGVTKDTTQPILTNVDEKPEFVGGQNDMFMWLGRNMRYPALARERQVQGTVYVGFVVETDGSLSNIGVKKTAKAPSVDTIIMVDPNTYKTQTKIVTNNDGKILDDEALSIVKAMPKWKAGSNKGKPARVAYTLPIKFKLE